MTHLLRDLHLDFICVLDNKSDSCWDMRSLNINKINTGFGMGFILCSYCSHTWTCGRLTHFAKKYHDHRRLKINKRLHYWNDGWIRAKRVRSILSVAIIGEQFTLDLQ